MFLATKSILLKLYFVFFYNIFLLKISDTPLRSSLHSPASFTMMFLKPTENSCSSARFASPLSSLPLHQRAVKDQVILRGQYVFLVNQLVKNGSSTSNLKPHCLSCNRTHYHARRKFRLTF